jgi:polysaccharide export outer membrane protein
VADKVTIIRNNPYGPEPIMIAASIREAKRNPAANLSLAPGDLITVEETPTTFVVDAMRNLLRFGFSAGIPGF